MNPQQIARMHKREDDMFVTILGTILIAFFAAGLGCGWLLFAPHQNATELQQPPPVK